MTFEVGDRVVFVKPGHGMDGLVGTVLGYPRISNNDWFYVTFDNLEHSVEYLCLTEELRRENGIQQG